ncbi:hypothetical protein KP509_12G062800 [Ceratopteris richardii]|uniref:Glycosyltransferase n=1 Tax=Ceratopteris richardii TaxID=49495 RepID=A0A8T2TQ97_CERRI|nr:hypothetical protein KP509_12G062800 [Ceratopteris richardii]
MTDSLPNPLDNPCTFVKESSHQQLPHLIVLSFPMQGHITPLFQLSHQLARAGPFRITFVVSDHTFSRLSHSSVAASATCPSYPRRSDDATEPHIRIVSIPDGLPAHHERDRSFFDQEQAMRGMQLPVQELLWKLQSDRESAVHFIVSDVFVTWSREVANRFKLPLLSFYTANATSCSVLYHGKTLMEEGIIPFKATDWAPPLRPHEFPPSMQTSDINSPHFRFSLSMFERIHECAGIVLNTVYDLEPRVVDALRERMAVFTIGPLLLPIGEEDVLPIEPVINFWEEDECEKWLSEQARESVLYVAFGSISTHTEEQFREMAMGLEECEQPFLWVVRKDALDGNMLQKALPEGYMNRIKGRGLIVSWAPQIRVLVHPSVGGFMTHCGWNSILENLSIAGVPMICWPQGADQMVNQRLFVDEWKVGLEVRSGSEGLVHRREVAEVVQHILCSEDGKECRRRALDWKRKLRKAVQEGGTTAVSLDRLVQTIQALSHR